ncbi:uncharacterized protein LOC130771066 [Actinidia eriantha]|uniref:uncharacterized protein LOC130771066 n=1 Tax=Actinidia eriantha TaxID=165200 RepID=UPI002585800E|nr:uncharacterized protein LOC130771066 [Actinidia eriantha]
MVAMKGHLCSGKTSLARSIAAAHKWPLISLDDHVNSHPFEALCQSALTQLNLGIHVVIDSPLSHQHHLDRLLQLSASTGARLIVVECKPGDKYEWRKRVEQRQSQWEDIEKLLEQQHDDASSSDCDATNFSKLVVDTTRYVRDSDLCRAVYYLAVCQETLRVDFSDWEGNPFQSRETEAEEKGKGKGKGKGHLHRLKLVDENQNKWDEPEVIRCRACLAPISGDLKYKCDGCDISVHKDCAELPDKKEIPPQNHSLFLQSLSQGYAFPKRKGSNLCETHKRDCYECSECLFKTNLRCRLLPSVVVLDNIHDHPLSLSIHPISSDYKFQCKLCGDMGEHVSYNCSACRFACHASCALLHRTSTTPYHGHPLTLSFYKVDDETEFYCNNCEGRRNPNRWVYCCSHCDFACHVNCVHRGA